MMSRAGVAVITIAAVMLAGCGGGGSGAMVPGASQPAASQPHADARAKRGRGTLNLRIHIPKRHHHRSVRVLRGGKPRYISPATRGMTIVVTGPTHLNETVSLQPDAQGCTGSLAGTFCVLTIPALNACPTKANCYTAKIATYDATSGCPSACSVAYANELSANQDVPFNIATGDGNQIDATLDGIPVDVALVPANGSSLSGDPYGGYSISKCGSNAASVLGIDADGNYILGAGAPAPTLSASNALVAVATPAPNAPNVFTLTPPALSPPNPGSTVNLSATVTPPAGSGATPVTRSPIVLTFNTDVCGVITEFPITTANSGPEDITVGPDNNLWFTELTGNNVAKITTAGTVTEYPITTHASGARGLTVGPDNNLWFTECAGNVSSITTAGSITEYSVGNVGPFSITAGADGDLWFSENGDGKVGQVDTGGALDGEFSTTSASSQPQGIASGPDGNLWMTEFNGNKIARITTAGVVTEYAIPTNNSQPVGIAAGPDNNLWFAESSGNKIARITTAGVITEFDVPTAASSPTEITTGPDGNLWFTEVAGHKIGQIGTDGTIVEFSTGLGGGNAPYYITTGPDCNVWFTDYGSNEIGRIQ